jgi:TolA-binding protein
MSPFNENSAFLYEELKTSIRETMTLIQALGKDNTEQQVEMATLETKLNSLAEDVEQLSHLIRDGNGSKSILTRLALIEAELTNHKTMMEEAKKWIDDATEALDLHKAEDQAAQKSKRKDTTFKREKLITVLQILPGAIALLMYLIQLYTNK